MLYRDIEAAVKRKNLAESVGLFTSFDWSRVYLDI